MALQDINLSIDRGDISALLATAAQEKAPYCG
mgnify:FL=1